MHFSQPFIQRPGVNPMQQTGSPYIQKPMNLTQFPPPSQNSFAIQNQTIPIQQNYQFDQVTEQVRNQFQRDLENNEERSKQIKELEHILLSQKNNAKNIMDKIELDLENERKQKNEIQNQFIQIKQDLQKKEILMAELDFKISGLQQDNNTLQTEKQQLSSTIYQLKEAMKIKINDYEDKLSQTKSVMDQMSNTFKNDYEQLEIKYQQQLEEINRNAEIRHQHQDNLLQQVQTQKKQVENKCQQLQDEINKMKLEAQEEAREMVVRIQEEEYRKYVSNLKMLEQKLQNVEIQKNDLANKCQQFQKDIIQRDQHFYDYSQKSDIEINNLKTELTEIKNQFNQADIVCGKLKSELQSRDKTIAKQEAYIAELQSKHSKEMSDKANEIERLNSQKLNEKKYNEDIKDQQQRKIAELEQIIHQKDKEFQSLKTEYERLCQMLQNNISKTIYQTLSDNIYGLKPNENALGNTMQTQNFSKSQYPPQFDAQQLNQSQNYMNQSSNMYNSKMINKY